MYVRVILKNGATPIKQEILAISFFVIVNFYCCFFVVIEFSLFCYVYVMLARRENNRKEISLEE